MKPTHAIQYVIPILLFLSLSFTVQASTDSNYINSGDSLWSQGKLEAAETDFRNELKVNPESSVAHQRLASLYLTQNKTKEAIDEYQNAITLDSENPKLFLGIAIAYLHLKYYVMAETMVMQAIELNPELEQAKKLKTYIDAKKDVVSAHPEINKALK